MTIEVTVIEPKKHDLNYENLSIVGYSGSENFEYAVPTFISSVIPKKRKKNKKNKSYSGYVRWCKHIKPMKEYLNIFGDVQK